MDMFQRFFTGVGVWSVVCGIVAIPSWLLSRHASPEGKLIGIVLWVMIYATFTATDSFAGRWRKRREKTALLITYGGRMFVSTFGMLVPPFMIVDMLCGMASVRLIRDLTGVDVTARSDLILETAMTTFVQGLLLSVLTLILWLIVRSICMAAMKPDAIENQPRGFEVVRAGAAMPVREVEP